MGIDGGTEYIKAGIYDLKGKTIGIGSSNYNTYYPYTGWAEQRIEEWREGLIKSIKEAICKFNELCNRYCIDTISTGSVLGMIMECYERGS